MKGGNSGRLVLPSSWQRGQQASPQGCGMLFYLQHSSRHVGGRAAAMAPVVQVEQRCYERREQHALPWRIPKQRPHLRGKEARGGRVGAA